MPDVSLCRNQLCPLREKCYRFTAKPNPLWQTYTGFQFEVLHSGKVICKAFWSNDEK